MEEGEGQKLSYFPILRKNHILCNEFYEECVWRGMPSFGIKTNNGLNDIMGIHLYLPPTLWAEFLSQCEDISLIIWFSGPDCDSHLKGKSKNLQYVRVRIFSQILDICGVHSIQFFILISKINFFFEIGPKLTFLRCFFHGTIFFAEEFLLS